MGKMVPYSGGMTEVRSEYNQIVAILLWWFAGVIGAHRFYTGKWMSGLLYLFTFGLFGIGWVYDGVMLVTGRFTDANGYVIGPPQQKRLPSGRPAPTERQLEDELNKLVDRDEPDVTRDEVDKELERDPLEEKFDELERELGKK